MAGFHTHITVSTACGIAYGGGAAFGYNVDPFAAMLGGGLCSLSGMLPDLDSDSGTPLREAVLFCSAVVPMMLLPRFQQAHLSHEMMILATAGVYAFIRFGLAGVMRKLTVHRGMFHSIPALLIAAEATFLLVGTGPPSERYFMAGGVALGFFSHLLLDEIWSVETKFGRVRLKSSFGTALKFWGDQWWPNLVTYGICGALTLAVVNDPRFAPPPIDVGHITNQIAGAIDDARDVVNDARGAGEQQQQKRDRWRDSPETVDRQAAHEEDFATRFWNSRRDGRSPDGRSPDDRLPAEPSPRAMQRDLEPRESPLSRYESPPRATIRARR